MVLLTTLAPATRDCMAALVAAVNGELMLEPTQGPGGGFSLAPAGSGPPGGTLPSLSAPEAAAEAEEGCLLFAFNQLSQQLAAGLRQLPQWIQATGLQDDEFMQVGEQGGWGWADG